MAALTIAVSVTGYVPSHDVGAMMLPVLPGTTCAVSRDLKHLKGRWIHIEGYGLRFVNDFTRRGLKHRIDLCVVDEAEARDVTMGKSEITGMSLDVYEGKSWTRAGKVVDKMSGLTLQMPSRNTGNPKPRRRRPMK
jgi:hypothetical protein